jgi:2-polyprenyl-3-methyl-5-hydroxy-6-metoxy-1,4-benzoquinol methylase
VLARKQDSGLVMNTVVALEGRQANLEKARFVKGILDLDHLELVLDDVRNLNKDRYGFFDVVLCLGILYHLDTPDVMNFVEKRVLRKLM